MLYLLQLRGTQNPNIVLAELPVGFGKSSCHKNLLSRVEVVIEGGEDGRDVINNMLNATGLHELPMLYVALAIQALWPIDGLAPSSSQRIAPAPLLLDFACTSPSSFSSRRPSPAPPGTLPV